MLKRKTTIKNCCLGNIEALKPHIKIAGKVLTIDVKKSGTIQSVTIKITKGKNRYVTRVLNKRKTVTLFQCYLNPRVKGNFQSLGNTVKGCV